MHDYASLSHGDLGLDRVPLLLATVMCPPLTLVPGARDLLLGGVQEGLEAGEMLLYFLKGSQSLGGLVDLAGERQGFSDQWLEFAYVLEDVGLAQVEEAAQER